MLSVSFSLAAIIAMLFGIDMSVANSELDCLNDPTFWPIPEGTPNL